MEEEKEEEKNGALMLLSEDEIKTIIMSLLKNHKDGLGEDQITSAINQASKYYTFGEMIRMALAGKIGLWLDPEGNLSFTLRGVEK